MKTQTVYFTAPGKTEVREETIAEPAANEVQVKCLANGICMAEVSLFAGMREPSKGFPVAVGHEGVGVVTQAGKNVTNAKEGDCVVCAKWSTYSNLNAANLIKFTQPLDDPARYIVEPPCCAVAAFHELALTPADRVLLIGAGYMGLLNLQMLANYPLAELVVSDVKQTNLDLAAEYGATETIRPGTPAGDARLKELENTPFDFVIECAGADPALQSAIKLTRRHGTVGVFSWHHSPRTFDLGYWHPHGLKILMIGFKDKAVMMRRTVPLLERGIIDQTKMITHRHHVADAQEAMEISTERPEGFVKGVLLFDE